MVTEDSAELLRLGLVSDETANVHVPHPLLEPMARVGVRNGRGPRSFEELARRAPVGLEVGGNFQVVDRPWEADERLPVDVPQR